jgi:excisionase family DNA binding protein
LLQGPAIFAIKRSRTAARLWHVGEEAMTVTEAAKRLQISGSKLYQLVAKRLITHYRIGGKIVFFEDDLAAYLATCRVGACLLQTQIARQPRLKFKHITLRGAAPDAKDNRVPA